MIHADAQALGRLTDLLEQLRTLSQLKEKRPGVFYRAGRAFLHFHREGEALFADVRAQEEFERFPVTTLPQRRALVRYVRQSLSSRGSV